MAEGIVPLINVSSLEKSTEFYKGLGLRVKGGGEGSMEWATVGSGEGQLILYPKDQAPDMEQPADTNAWLSGELGKGLVIMIGVGDARENWDKAKAMNVSVDQPLDENPWGGRSFRVSDPDGYLLSISDNFPG